MRLFRLFRLLDLLRLRTSPVTAQALAVKFGVSVRSIYRDIADLQAMGAPIRGEGGMGYVMENGYVLPSLRFTAEELDAIVLGLRLVAARSTPSLDRAAQRAAAKISSAIGDKGRDEIASLPLAAGPSRAAKAGPEAALMEFLRGAIRSNEILSIDYENAAGSRSVRLARALGLTVFDDAWLFTIWCEKSNDFRHLRVDRILSAVKTGNRFRAEKGKRFKDALDLEHQKSGRATA